jgi:glycosyltransferase involved in cell wall biosynthesis
MEPQIPPVSIVVTCYNYGRYLTGCLNSVMAQTFQDFEVVVVDDGSTDDTSEKIKPFLSDRRLTYIRQPNGGQARAKNRGIRESRGGFVAFLDADDMWHPEKLAKQMPLFADPKVGVVYSRARYIDVSDQELDLEIGHLNKYLQPRQGRVLKHLLFDNFVPFSSAVVRRRLIGEGFNENIKMGIDWELWLRISLDHEFREVPEKLLLYRMGHPGQMSKNQEERFRSTDVILDRFLAGHGHRIKKRWMHAAMCYKFYLRADYYHRIDPKQCLWYLCKAIRMGPFFTPNWKVSIKLLLSLFYPYARKTAS